MIGDYPYLTAEDAKSAERTEKLFSACSTVKGNGVEKPAFSLVGNHQ
jgi:hypothetical protein